MDIARPEFKERKRRRQIIMVAVIVVAVVAVSAFVYRLKPAAPSVERGTVWTDTVKRGSMLRQVRGIGTLVPSQESVLQIPAETEATVVRIRVLPGTVVKPDTIILDMSNSQVDQMRALAELKQQQLDALKVRAKIDGVLVEMPLHVGEHVAPGTMLAKVVQPNHLMAELKVAETQARDVQIGESVSVDTHNGLISGSVMRVDPAVQNGTVTVDVKLTGELPRGASPNLSVDGTIDLEKLDNVLYVGRPAFGQENSTISLFKLDPNGHDAVRAPVKVGRASVNSIQILDGLHEGDTVVLSDMSRWDNTDRIRLQD